MKVELMCVGVLVLLHGTQSLIADHTIMIMSEYLPTDFWDFERTSETSFKLTRKYMKEKGTIFSSVNPGLPSLRFPRFYSLMTGLSSEQHGIMGDFGIIKVGEQYEAADQLLEDLPYIWKTIEDLVDKEKFAIHKYGVEEGKISQQGRYHSFNDNPTDFIPASINYIFDQIEEYTSIGTKSFHFLFMRESNMYSKSLCQESDRMHALYGTAEKTVTDILEQLNNSHLSQTVNVIFAGIVSPNFAPVSEEFTINIEPIVAKCHIGHLCVAIRDTLHPFVLLAPTDGNVEKLYQELLQFAADHSNRLSVELTSEMDEEWKVHGVFSHPIAVYTTYPYILRLARDTSLSTCKVIDWGFSRNNQQSDLITSLALLGPDFASIGKGYNTTNIELLDIKWMLLDWLELVNANLMKKENTTLRCRELGNAENSSEVCFQLVATCSLWTGIAGKTCTNDDDKIFAHVCPISSQCFYEMSKLCKALDNHLADTNPTISGNWIKQIVFECSHRGNESKNINSVEQECLYKCETIVNESDILDQYNCLDGCFNFYWRKSYSGNESFDTSEEEDVQCYDDMKHGSQFKESVFDTIKSSLRAHGPNYVDLSESNTLQQKFIFLVLAILLVLALTFIVLFILRIREQYFDFL